MYGYALINRNSIQIHTYRYPQTHKHTNTQRDRHSARKHFQTHAYTSHTYPKILHQKSDLYLSANRSMWSTEEAARFDLCIKWGQSTSWGIRSAGGSRRRRGKGKGERGKRTEGEGGTADETVRQTVRTKIITTKSSILSDSTTVKRLVLRNGCKACEPVHLFSYPPLPIFSSPLRLYAPYLHVSFSSSHLVLTYLGVITPKINAPKIACTPCQVILSGLVCVTQQLWVVCGVWCVLRGVW